MIAIFSYGKLLDKTYLNVFTRNNNTDRKMLRVICQLCPFKENLGKNGEIHRRAATPFVQTGTTKTSEK